MTGPPRTPLVVAAIVVPVLLTTAVWLQAVRDTHLQLPVSGEESLYLSGRAASAIAFAYRPLAADLYWIRAIQYYGGHHRQARALEEDPLAPPAALALTPPVNYDLLYPLLDTTTTLDPRFSIAYRYGAIFLSQQPPAGAGRPDQAIALLEKGARVSPEKWQYLHDIAFVYYWELHDYVAAARYLTRAADIPGAPPWLRFTAASMLVKGGHRSASRLMWRQLYDDPPDESAREAAAVKLHQLDALDQIDQLQAVVDRFIRTRGAVPQSWLPLVAAGLLRGVPLDPGGTPYELADGRVVLSMHSLLYPLPVEPAASGPQPTS